MIEDMKLRGLTPCTQATYLEAVKVLARHYNSRLDEITREQVRDFLLYLLDSKEYAKSTYKVYLSAIKFLYLNTLDRQWRLPRDLIWDRLQSRDANQQDYPSDSE
jgi:integrase/recombinase XerD